MSSYYLNILESSCFIIASWAFCIFVAWYFFHHTKKKFRIGFIKTISIISILFFLFLTYTWYNNRPPFKPVRLAIFPFQKQTNNTEVLSWESLALSYIPTDNINQVNPKSLLSYNLEWIAKAVNLDSLVFPLYLKEFSKRVNLDFIVFGKLKKTTSHYEIEFQIFNTRAEAEVLNERIKIHPDEILDFCDTLSQTILNYLSVSDENADFKNNWHSASNFQNYFDLQLYLLTDQTEPAFEISKMAVKQDSSSVTWLNLLAELYIKAGTEKKYNGEDSLSDFQNAKSILLKALSFHRNSTSLRLLGELYLSNEKWSQAEDYLKNSFSLNSMDPYTYLDLTQLHPSRYASLGFKKETELLKRAIFINPGFFEAYLTLANKYSLQNHHNSALNMVREVLRINPVYVEGLMSLGKIYLTQNKILDVLETYQKIIELDPYNSDVYYNLGIVYYYQKDYDNAIKFFERAIELSDHLDSRLYLAYIHEKRGDIEKAVEFLQTRIRKRRNSKDEYAEEARKHLYQIMTERGVIDSLNIKTEK